MSSDDPIVEAVRAKLLARSQAGITKYGTTLNRDDLATLDWLRHAQEESIDHANYLEVLIQREERRMNDPDGYAEPQASTTRMTPREWVVAWQEQGEPIRRRRFYDEKIAKAWRDDMAANPSCMTWLSSTGDTIASDFPSPTRTLRIDPHTESLMRPLEPGEELCVVNESGYKVAVRMERSPTVSTLRNLIAELERERDAYRQCLEDLAGHLDYLQELWGAEGVTRRVAQQVRECLKGESEVSE